MVLNPDLCASYNHHGSSGVHSGGYKVMFVRMLCICLWVYCVQEQTKFKEINAIIVYSNVLSTISVSYLC